MAAPNIIDVTSIYGKTVGLAVTTAYQTIVTNTAGSGKVLKINTLTLANVDGTNTAVGSAKVLGAASYELVKTASIPAGTTLVVISKDTSIYLEEGVSIQVLASANSDIVAVCSYEEIN